MIVDHAHPARTATTAPDYHGNAVLKRLLREPCATYSSEDAWRAYEAEVWQHNRRLWDVLALPLPAVNEGTW